MYTVFLQIYCPFANCTFYGVELMSTNLFRTALFV